MFEITPSHIIGIKGRKQSFFFLPFMLAFTVSERVIGLKKTFENLSLNLDKNVVMFSYKNNSLF